ncbi:sunset domain-containing protein [Amycolatopsis samaneae]|uniref:Uncharacterized protein n=1 Tax=Amycolatopsis samaneae TaxID=664691 RepID=A0ABW5GG69_9PSEU
MSIFGQVWLWSLLAFFIGVLLTWLLLVLPARKRVRELEGALTDARADAARTPVNAGALAAGAGVVGAAATGTAIFARPGADEEPPAPAYPATIVEQEPVADPKTPEVPEREHIAEGFLDVPAEREPDKAVPDEAVSDEEALAATQVFSPEPGYPTVEHEAGELVLPEPEPEVPHESLPEPESAYEEAERAVEPDYRAAATQYLSVPAEETEYLRPVEPPRAEEPAPSGSLFSSAPDGPEHGDDVESAYDTTESVYAGLEHGAHEHFASEHFAPEHSVSEQDEPEPVEAEPVVSETPEQEEAPAGSLFRSEPVAETPPRSMLEQKLDPGSEPVSLFQPSSRTEPHPAPDWFDQEPLPERSPFEEPEAAYLGEHEATEHVASPSHPATASDEPAYAFGGGEETATGGVLDEVPEETPAETTQMLPKRQPREAPRGGFEPPRPIQPSMRPVERREPEGAGAHSGSLFEPSVQPNQVAASMAQQAAPEPPPAREVAEDAVPPGPFGPGSAMPRPGGGRPAEGFAVKASVTALRYCTEESPQFPRMVAEVWFRTPSDAERVGFRPLT